MYLYIHSVIATLMILYPLVIYVGIYPKHVESMQKRLLMTKRGWMGEYEMLGRICLFLFFNPCFTINFSFLPLLLLLLLLLFFFFSLS